MSQRLDGVDTHAHIIGSQIDYPMTPERRYTPGVATDTDLQAHLQKQGLGRAVIVQPSFYGFDNRCMLDALQTLANRQVEVRGVAVLPQTVSIDEIKRLDALGVRGIRLNIESTGHFNAADLAVQLTFWGAMLADFGWHIQVYAPMAWLASCEAVIAKSPVPVVLDHFALWSDAACTTPESAALVRLLESGNIYIKLSASYRVRIASGEATGDAEANAAKANGLCSLAHRLLAINPERLLWGSDWPHTNKETGRSALEVSQFRKIDPVVLAQERMGWLTQISTKTDWQPSVLVSNPVRLYRF